MSKTPPNRVAVEYYIINIPLPESDTFSNLKRPTLIESSSCYAIKVIQYCMAQGEAESSLQWVSEHPITGKNCKRNTHIPYIYRRDKKVL